MKSAMIKLRVPTNELNAWRMKAVEKRQNLSEFVRSCCTWFVHSPVESIPSAPIRVENLTVRASSGYIKAADSPILPVSPALEDKPAALTVADIKRSIIESNNANLSPCSHLYGPKACPFPGCSNYKWRDS